MDYDLTQHAKTAIAERRIQAGWIERVLDSPQKTEPDTADPELIHHLGGIQEYGNRVLRVVVNPRVTPVRIVTAFFDRRMKGRL